MTHPRFIGDHVYRTDYAGLDPAKQLCTFAHVDAPPCGKPRDRHLHFVTNYATDQSVPAKPTPTN